MKLRRCETDQALFLELFSLLFRVFSLVARNFEPVLSSIHVPTVAKHRVASSDAAEALRRGNTRIPSLIRN